MEEEILRKIKEQEEKIDKIYEAVEKTRKFFLYTLIVTLVIVLLPIIGMVFIVPRILSIYMDIYSF